MPRRFLLRGLIVKREGSVIKVLYSDLGSVNVKRSPLERSPSDVHLLEGAGTLNMWLVVWALPLGRQIVLSSCRRETTDISDMRSRDCAL